MAYYAQLNPGQNVGHQPNDYVDINNSTYIDWVHPGAGMSDMLCYRIFEVLISAVLFPNTSITVHWSVFGGSDTHAINSTVGTANNGYEYFWIFKDAGQFLYEVGNWSCYSEFWAY